MTEPSPELVYGHLIEAITGGLYPNKMDVVREYIQNAYDAIRARIRDVPTLEEKEALKQYLRVDVVIEAGSLFIQDNALGMDYNTLNEYRKIGFSKKRYGDFAGWRGIGKAAGLSVSEKLIVTTSIGNGETHQLIFNSDNMLKEVYELRAKGENIPFSKLIEKHSEIKTIPEGDTRFTNIELHLIKPDSNALLDEEKLKSHLSLLAPLPFQPDFAYKDEIETELQMALDEYITINLFVNNVQIFKPYLHKWEDTSIDRPSTVSIYDEEGQELIAFCWYCMNNGKGQITTEISHKNMTPIPIQGLIYRVDDIKIGDSNLTRNTLWLKDPHLAFYALGEIHIIDNTVEPSSDRNDFVDNFGRFRLFKQCIPIAQDISRKGRKSSAESRAERKITEAGEKLEKISEQVAQKMVPKEVISTYIYQLEDIKQEAQKRKPATPEEDLKDKADLIIRESNALLKQLTTVITTPVQDLNDDDKIFIDTPKKLKMSEEGELIYNTILNILRDFYSGRPEVFEELVSKISSALDDVLS